jgi:hypothetical protein
MSGVEADSGKKEAVRQAAGIFQASFRVVEPGTQLRANREMIYMKATFPSMFSNYIAQRCGSGDILQAKKKAATLCTADCSPD